MNLKFAVYHLGKKQEKRGPEGGKHRYNKNVSIFRICLTLEMDSTHKNWSMSKIWACVYQNKYKV
jgi:hypothetical protein